MWKDYEVRYEIKYFMLLQFNKFCYYEVLLHLVVFLFCQECFPCLGVPYLNVENVEKIIKISSMPWNEYQKPF